MRILVVEDEARIADYLKKGFTESGYQVEVAKDGLEGRYLLEESVFDLVTLDIMLPGLNDWQLLQFIRSQGDTPVICLSAQDAVEDKVRGLEQGADDYLAKPFSFAELLARARKLAGGALIAFLLGWLVSRRGLKPVRRLATEAGAIEVRRLHRRLNTQQLPEELGELGKSLNHMLARLEDGFGRLSRFSEDLAHEIRTPLSNLMGHTEHALRQARSREEYESLLASHLEEYQRLSRMINSMLFLARSEQPQAGIQPEAVALTPLMEQLCDYFEGMAEEAGTTLINQAHGEVWADAELLRRASPLPSAASTAAMAWRSACTTADRSLPESIYPACLIAFTAATRPALRAAIPAAWGWPLSTPLCCCTVVK